MFVLFREFDTTGNSEADQTVELKFSDIGYREKVQIKSRNCLSKSRVYIEEPKLALSLKNHLESS